MLLQSDRRPFGFGGGGGGGGGRVASCCSNNKNISSSTVTTSPDLQDQRQILVRCTSSCTLAVGVSIGKALNEGKARQYDILCMLPLPTSCVKDLYKAARVLQCIRGARSHQGHAFKSQSIALVTTEAHI